MKIKNLEAIHPEIIKAAYEASAQLAAIGVPHALVGGLAVAAHGYTRATRDVDFLVGEEAFHGDPGGLVTFAPGVPIKIGGVAIDMVPIPAIHEHLIDSLEMPPEGGVPVIGIGPLVFMKLSTGRRKDISDVVELVVAGIDTKEVQTYLEDNAPEYVDMFESLVEEVDR